MFLKREVIIIMNKHLKHLLLTMCIFVFGFALTGCGIATTTSVKITSATKASCTVSIGFDDEALNALAQNMDSSKTELIKEMKKSGAKYTKKKLDGIYYNIFYSTIHNKNLSDIEKLLSEAGYTNVCVSPKYFFATLDPKSAQKGSSYGSGSSINLTDMDDISFYMSMKITFKSKVNFTNGTVSKDGKTVSWVIKDAEKVTRLCASTTKVNKTARSKSVVNGKTYKPGKKLTVSNPKSLAKMKLDGKAVKPGKAVLKKGTHKLIIWSKDGKVQRVTFKIK